MTNKYTRESPFEFEGGSLWRNRRGGVAYDMPWTTNDIGANTWLARAHHAFIVAEQERTGWHWTNDEHTEARHGRWRVYLFGGPWWLAHDDFGDAFIWQNGSVKVTDNVSEVFVDTMQDFLTWRTEQEKPEEPSGFGAVVSTGAGNHYTHRSTGANGRWANAHFWDLSWGSVLAEGDVKVLSEGVTP